MPSKRKRKPARAAARRHAWASLPEDELLALRLKDLKVDVKSRWLQARIRELNEELAQRGIRVRPHYWIADEWFSPSDTPGIAIPFYLAHPRLKRLEQKKIIEVEGGTVWECMRILRHEAGHVVQHSYALHRRRRWQEVFGPSSTRYPTAYRPNPASKNFVQHLRLWYAQSHPDEDFAETFAVWLTPRSGWRKRYAGWPALKKLEYVDELMAEIAEERPILTRRFDVDPLRTNKRTLAEHYKRKMDYYAVAPRKTYDRDLLRIFSNQPKHRRSEPASVFIRRHRAQLRPLVSKWTGEYQLTLDSIIENMIDRCRELKLRAVGSERKLKADFTVLLTAKTVHALYGSARRQSFAL